MHTMHELYVEVEENKDLNGIFTSIQSFIALYVYRYLGCPKNIKLQYVCTKFESSCGRIKLSSETFNENLVCKKSTNIQVIRDLRLPVYVKDDNTTFIAGMCAVARELISSQSCTEYHALLGFKESCLLAPAESSIWTRFCELDLPTSVSKLLKLIELGQQIEEVPIGITRFENHMREPVRMHNIYKLAREQANEKVITKGEGKKKNSKIIIECTTPKEQLSIQHRFAEGVAFTIADLILYPCIRIISKMCYGMSNSFPLTTAWLNEIQLFHDRCEEILDELINNYPCDEIKYLQQNITLRILESSATSLYKSDTKRYKPRNRIYTDQNEVHAAIEKAQSLGLEYTSDSPITYELDKVNWSSIEPNHEKNSELPPQRLLRKRQQLENLANAVKSLAADGDRIIDFCSGTGHLGILLALQLPSCTVILMENKSISLERAKKRAKELELENIRFYQCNIDYFVGSFDIGTSLHACGTATDIVLQQCLRSKAKFVCCPCCYGALQPMPHIVYPMSRLYRRVLNEKDFLYIAHTADQAHELGTLNCKPETTRQGQLCMAIMDIDRKLRAEEDGYSVILTRLKPEQCSPKNHLLVGTPNSMKR